LPRDEDVVVAQEDKEQRRGGLKLVGMLSPPQASNSVIAATATALPLQSSPATKGRGLRASTTHVRRS
jgi:hypothetical protein